MSDALTMGLWSTVEGLSAVYIDHAFGFEHGSDGVLGGILHCKIWGAV